MRGKKLRTGDVVSVEGYQVTVKWLGDVYRKVFG
jgi:ribosome-associated protein YbcJ (S4-like RNA binding protein)